MIDDSPVADVVGSARRVLVVASELPPGPGGIGAHAFAVATELHRQGREVTLLGSQHYVDDDARACFAADSPIPILTLPDGPDPARTAWARSRTIRRTIQTVRPDVVVASGGRILWLTAHAVARAKVSMVAVAHGTELGWSGWKAALTRRSFDAATCVVAVSEFTAGLAHDFGIRRSVEVIPNGADADRFAPSSERRERFRSCHGLGDRPVVLTVGNVTERKGQHRVVEALPLLVAEIPDAAYVVVGRPTDAVALEARARALGVAKHLVVVGQVEPDEVVDAHAAADVFAMTSTATGTGDVEGYGIAVVEAALSGVPAVVTRGTGAEEAVVDGESGWAVADEPAAIADALARLLGDADRRAAMGRAAERAARASGSWPHRVAHYGQVLDRVVAGSRPRIVVVSHTEHWRDEDGSIVGFGPTTRELDHLATLASELVHVAPLHEQPAPGNALASQASNLRVVTVAAAGGNSLPDKFRAVARMPQWAWTINREVSTADIVHVRCPAGISMVALGVLAVRRRPKDRWVKYAGNWRPEVPDSRTYGWQRAWLRRGWARAVVTVNGRWPDEPPWVRAFDNPTLTDDELAAGRHAAAERPIPPPWRVVFAGRLEAAKGADVVVDTVVELRRRGHDVHLDLVGDGPLRAELEDRMRSELAGVSTAHGWMTRSALERVLAHGHLFLLPSRSEGFPKVVAEALAFGCVPVVSDVSSIGQVLAETGGGVAVSPGASWIDEVETLITGGDWAMLAAAGPKGATRFSYPVYLQRVRDMAADEWGRSL